MNIPASWIALGAKLLEGSHRICATVTGGRYPKTLLGMELLELHTIGRKTGQLRSTLLSTPIYDGNQLILVASKGGYPDDPMWYKNLVANPQVSITMHGVTTAMIARTATEAERAELWPRITKVAATYAGYQKRAPREIPVVICEPANPAVSPEENSPLKDQSNEHQADD